MADMTRLLNGLRSYDAALVHHNAKVSEAFQQLTRSLARLSQVYEGAAARDFKSHFARTRSGLDDYLTGTKAIQRLLRDRIDHLAEADRPGGL